MRRGARATLLVAWLLVLAGLGWVVAQRLKVSTDLRSFMPAPTTPDQRLLMEQVGEGPGSRLLLLAISQRKLRPVLARSAAAAVSLPAFAHAGHATAGRGLPGRPIATAAG